MLWEATGPSIRVREADPSWTYSLDPHHEPEVQPSSVTLPPTRGWQRNTCYVKTLCLGVVCYGALLQQELTTTLLYKVASFTTAHVLGVKNTLVQLALKLCFFQKANFSKIIRMGIEENIFFLVFFILTSLPNYMICENWPVILLFFISVVGTN